MDDSLSLSITHDDGQVTRWSADEVDGANIPGGLSFGTSIPGGYRDMTCELLRRIDLDYADQALLSTVTVHGPGNETVWEGRLVAFPRSHGEGFSIKPQAVGWSSHLKDDPSFVEVYVDRDLSAWGTLPLAEKERLAAAGVDFGSISFSTDREGLTVALPNQALGAQVQAETWYTAPAGVTIEEVIYKGSRTTFPAGWEANAIKFNSSDSLAGAQTIAATLDGTQRVLNPATPTRYVILSAYSNGSATTPAAGASERWSVVALYGDHGLTTYTISGEPNGVKASDVIPNVLDRAAPLLTYSTGDGGSIEPTSFVIPHLAFKEPITAEDAILATNTFHMWEWGVWADREFFYRPTDPDRLCWEARISDGIQLDMEGDQADDLYNGIQVIFTEAGTGLRRVAGPPGSASDYTDSALEDTCEENPVNAFGIPRKWPPGGLTISQPITRTAAVQLGSVWLAEQSIPARRGSMSVAGTLNHPTKGPRPVWEIKAGDYVRISDHPADVPRRILETRYDHPTRRVTLTLSNTAPKLDALFERYASALIGKGV